MRIIERYLVAMKARDLPILAALDPLCHKTEKARAAARKAVTDHDAEAHKRDGA